MCVQAVTNTTDVSSGEESAQNIETSKQSGGSCRLLCNPQRLPEPKAPRTKLPDAKKMTMETKHVVRDFFWDRYAKGEKQARERRWI